MTRFTTVFFDVEFQFLDCLLIYFEIFEYFVAPCDGSSNSEKLCNLNSGMVSFWGQKSIPNTN